MQEKPSELGLYSLDILHRDLEKKSAKKMQHPSCKPTNIAQTCHKVEFQILPGWISINFNVHPCCHSYKSLVVGSVKSSKPYSQHMVARSFLYFHS
jgi:hypothetical protein